MARRHLGFIVPSFLSLCVALLPMGPAGALATLRVNPSALSLSDAVPEQPPRPSLAETALELEAQAGALYNAGRYDEALQVQRRSVEGHRRLVAQDPSQSLRLAASLHNLGVVLIRLGRKAEALAPTAEALAIYRTAPSVQGGEALVAQERPLRNLVLLLYEGNRPQEALPLADALLLLHQQGRGRDPLAEAGLIDIFNLRASLFVVLNRPQEALQDLESAVALARRMAGPSAGNPALRHGLAGSLLNLSQVADLLNQPARALPPAQEAEVLLRGLARQHPGLRADWARALRRLGQAHAATGDAIQAQLALQESIAVLRTLDPAGPSATLALDAGGHRDDLAQALEALAVVHHRLHQPREARAAGQEAIRLYSALARSDPRYRQDVERTRAWLTSWPLATPAQR